MRDWLVRCCTDDVEKKGKMGVVKGIIVVSKWANIDTCIERFLLSWHKYRLLA